MMDVRKVALLLLPALVFGVCFASASEFRGDPEAARPLDEQARHAYESEEFGEAGRLFEQAYEAYERPEFLFNSGQCHRRADQHEQAAAAFRRYLSVAPEPAPIAFLHFADCSRQANGDLIEAIRAYQQYLDHDLMSEHAAHARIAIATGLPYERHDPDTVEQVRDHYNRAMELYAEPGQERQTAEWLIQGYERLHIGEFLYNAAGVYEIEQMWSDAARTYRRYLETPNPRPGAWVDLARCLYMAGDDEGARRAAHSYQSALDRGPRWQEATEIIQATAVAGDAPTAGNRQAAAEAFRRGEQHYDRGELDEALRAFRDAYEFTRDRTSLFNIGMCHTSARNWAEAARHWSEYAQGGDQGVDAVAHLLAAQAYLQRGNADEARRHLQAYVQRADEQDLPNEAADRQWAEGMGRDAGRAGSGGQ